jgi:hypothetical protein
MQGHNSVRFQPAEGDSLNDLLRKYFEKARSARTKDRWRFPGMRWLDESYVSRPISGERLAPQPRRSDFAWSLGLERAVHEHDVLPIAAEYKPQVPSRESSLAVWRR